MSSIWTPSGEHEPHDQGPGPSGGDAATRPGTTQPEMSQEAYEELVRTRAELSAIPVVDIVANHAVGLWQLAILHLTPDPGPDGLPAEPRLPEAGLAIDALGALVDTLGERLEPHYDALREAVTQLRLAFVELSSPQ